ncbi:MAG TPA: fibronectin type III domain-containing protein [Candidatus Binatus sp.]|nr:fibronectin type III domain-containing protein [Candidatus Binatus sp.]
MTWDAEADPTVIGYKVYSGTSSRAYSSPVDVQTQTTLQMNNLLSGNTYYFAVTAYNSGGESGYSNEVSLSVP